MSASEDAVPSYLADRADVWRTDPHAANLAWWREAKFGLFMHYGLYSQLGAGEWVQLRRKIPVAEYEKLRDTFTAEKYDADFITDLACEAGMRYVNLVTCHHDGFCLWDSDLEEFNSMRSPCGRDLVAETAEQCAEKGLGFFTYYTYMLNWRFPYYCTREHFKHARPDYDFDEPRYRFRSVEEDWPKYREYSHGCIAELLTKFGPLAGMWLDLIMFYYSCPDMSFPRETYALIRRLQPHALISWKQGATGTEDFATPEQHFHSQEDSCRRQGLGERACRLAREAWEANVTKHNEICGTLQERGWGYVEDSPHRDADEVWRRLTHAVTNDCNLLMNTGPLPDGSIHPADVATLREVGRRIRKHGYPGPAPRSGPCRPPAPRTRDGSRTLTARARAA
ncbi:MAG: alpha-L-fucosidase [Planctomycetota bacterium]